MPCLLLHRLRHRVPIQLCSQYRECICLAADKHARVAGCYVAAMYPGCAGMLSLCSTYILISAYSVWCS